MKKPSVEDYPDYYEVINTPIDMEMIEEKMLNSIYKAEDELIPI